MSFEAVERIAKTLLYEGYILFPYSARSLKNRARVSFGELVPRGRMGRTRQTSELLVEPTPAATLELRIAFLQPVRRRLSDPSGRAVEVLETPERRVDAWQEAREIIILPPSFSWSRLASEGRLVLSVDAAALDETEALESDGALVGSILRVGQALRAEVTLEARPVTGDAYLLRCDIANVTTPSTRDDEGLDAMHSVHVAMRIEHGAFVSVIDPPPALRDAAEGCESEGAWPVLVGPREDRSMVLLSPIILYDHPEIAPESPLDLFDATENDELLSLSILALSDDERRAMAASDPRAKAVLERIEAAHGLSSQGMPALHGATRSLRTAPERGGPRVRVGDRFVGVGDAVTLAPSGRDALDTVLVGARAIVVDVQVDVQGREHLVVVLDEDPGRELGLAGVGVGHRMFVDAREVVAS